MSSFFRTPGEDSSTDSSSPDHEEKIDTSQSGLDRVTRVNTLEPNGSEQPSNIEHSRPAGSSDNNQLRDLLLHSLLEDKALLEAADHLKKGKDDTEVQKLAQSTYQALSQQLAGGSSGMDQTYASEAMRQQRQTFQSGVAQMTRRHMAQITQTSRDQSQALSTRATSGPFAKDYSQIEQAQPIQALSQQPPFLPGFDTLLASVSRALPLQGHPGVHTDRYLHDFVEIDMIGKGGYGRVYKVQHKLDDSFYAIKRIPISQAIIRKIEQNGKQEMECILQEVRALARFDHRNIARYHNAWLEVTSGPIASPWHGQTYNSKLLNGSPKESSAGDLDTGLSNLSIESHNDSFGANIVFGEDSDPFAQEPNIEVDEKEFSNASVPVPTQHRRRRRSSRATIETLTSSLPQQSPPENIVNENEEIDEEFSRSDIHYPYDGPTTGVSDSDLIGGELVRARPTGPVLTLNVQMSLYESNLSAFLVTYFDPPVCPLKSGSQPLRHCFHPCISVEILQRIHAGVEYLHAQGVVHRDLKPANVFLAVSDSRIYSSGAIDLSSCRNCAGLPDPSGVFINPRIGDFGLVAALAGNTSAGNEKPVGTEFYRPAAASGLSPKIDVFALGVIGFELVWKFDTRSERALVLSALKMGEFPVGFSEKVGLGGVEVMEAIRAMTRGDETTRLSCEEAGKRLSAIVALYRA